MSIMKQEELKIKPFFLVLCFILRTIFKTQRTISIVVFYAVMQSCRWLPMFRINALLTPSRLNFNTVTGLRTSKFRNSAPLVSYTIIWVCKHLWQQFTPYISIVISWIRFCIWGTAITHDVSGVRCTPVFTWLVVQWLQTVPMILVFM
jgi:hypothetical protein